MKSAHETDLEERIRRLEDRVVKLEVSKLEKFQAQQIEPSSMSVKSLEDKGYEAHEDALELRIQREREEAEKETPSEPNPVIEWLKKDFLMKTGVLLLILALAWFVTYAFRNGWVGPTGQIAIGILVGTGIMMFGHMLMPKMSSPGQVLTVTGGTMILLTLYAARSHYGFFTPISALLMMGLVIATMAMIAVYRDAKGVAVTALLGGSIIPYLAGRGSGDQMILPTTMLFLDLGAIGIAYLKPWKQLVPLALILTGLTSFQFDVPTQFTFILLGYILAINIGAIAIATKRDWEWLVPMATALAALIFSSLDLANGNALYLFGSIFILDLLYLATAHKTKWESTDLMALLFTALLSFKLGRLDDVHQWIFMGLFFTLFFVSNLVKVVRMQKAEATDLVLSGANGILLLIWILNFAPKEWQSIILGVSVVAFMGITLLATGRSKDKSSIAISSCLAILFLGTATAIELKGATLTLAFQIEALLLVLMGLFVLKNVKIAHYLALLNTIPAMLALVSFKVYSEKATLIFDKHFFVIIFLIVGFGLMAVMLFKEGDSPEYSPIPISLTAVASLAFVAFIWLFAHKVFESGNLARGVSLFIYTLIGLSLYFYSNEAKYSYLRFIGGAMLGLVIVRLGLVEIWAMSTLARIGTFVAIGVLLVASAFRFRKPAK